MTMRRGGFTDEDDRLAKLLMAEFERVEHRPVTASWVATFADMARAVRMDREESAAVPGPVGTGSGREFERDVAILDAIRALRAEAAEERVALHIKGEPLTDYGSGVLDGLDWAWLAGRKAAKRPPDGRTSTSIKEWWACDDAYEQGLADATARLAAVLPAPVGEGDGLDDVLAAHVVVYENDGGDYGGRSWIECSCDADNWLNPTEYASEEAHRAHVAEQVRAAGWRRQ